MAVMCLVGASGCVVPAGCAAAASTLKRELQAEVNAVATALAVIPPLYVDVRYREDNVVGLLSFQPTRLRRVSDARP